MLVQYFKQNFISENVNPDFKVSKLLLDENPFPCVGQEEVVGGCGMCLGQLFNISLYLYFLMFNSAQPEWIPFQVYVAHPNNQTLA